MQKSQGSVFHLIFIQFADFFIFFSMLEMNVCRTVRTCSSETDASVFFFFRSHSCANKVRERGWENGGLMYLIRGVALVIGGHATRGRVGKAGWDGRGTSMGDIHICKGTLLLRRQKQEKQSGEEPMLTCHWCGRDVALLYLRQCVRLIGAAAPRVWAEWNSVFCGEINICSTFSLDPSVLLCALTSLGLRLESEKVGVCKHSFLWLGIFDQNN